MGREVSQYIILKKKKVAILFIKNSHLKISDAKLYKKDVLVKFIFVKLRVLDLFDQLIIGRCGLQIILNLPVARSGHIGL